MKTSKKVLLMLSILLTLGIIVACGNDGTNGNGGSDGASSDSVLRILVAGDSSEGGAMADAAERYTEETDIPVEIIEVPDGDLETRLRNMISGGDAPAMVEHWAWGPFSDQLIDLSDVVDLGRLPDVIQERVEVDGKVEALPTDVTTTGLFYNKTLFDEAGVSVPETEDDIWTWEEFEEAIRTVLDNTDVMGGVSLDYSSHRLLSMMHQFGGSVLDPDAEMVVANSPENIEALSEFKRMHDEGIMPDTVWLGSEDPSALFKAGQLAAHYSGNWNMTDYIENIEDFEWGVTYMPYKDQRASKLGGNFIMGIEGTGLEEETIEFLTWFYEDDNYAAYLDKGNYMSGLTDISPDYGEYNDHYAFFEDEIAATGEIVVGDYMNDFVNYVGNLLRDETELMLNGDKTPEEVLENFAGQVSQEMDLPLQE